MFDIEYKGGNTVIISGKQSSIVFDPRLSVVGLSDIRLKDRIEALTEARFGLDHSTARLVVSSPGEYEMADFAIRGIAATRYIDTPEQERQAVIYRVELADVRVAVFGNIQAKLSEEQLESIGVVDILILPVGGGSYTLDATDAVALVAAVEPKVVIPVHYAEPALKYEVPQEPLNAFTAKLGALIETTSKYKIKSASSLPSALTVIELTRS